MKPKKSITLVRAYSIVAVLAVILGGVTFAALRSQNNYVTGSRMTSASADLKIAKQFNGVYADTVPGFDFLNVAPGGVAMPRNGNDLYFRNTGTEYMDLQLNISPERLLNANGVALDKAHIVITNDLGTVYASPSIAELIDADGAIPLGVGVIGGGGIQRVRIMMQLDDGAVPNITQAHINDIDLVFSGVSQD